MTVLNRVEWPTVFRRLLDSADEPLRERALRYAGLRTAIPAPVAAFAAVVCGLPARMVAAALRELDADTAWLLSTWLRDQAHVVLAAACRAADPRPSAKPARPGVLLIDPDLDHLPLLDLAAAIALRGGLVAEVGTLWPGVCGLYDPNTGRITLDLDQGAGEQTWAHELAHALDPLLGQREAPDLDEQFADDLGALLLAERPRTLAEAAPLIAQTRTDRERGRGSGSQPGAKRTPTPRGNAELPEPGAASLVAFLGLGSRLIEAIKEVRP